MQNSEGAKWLEGNLQITGVEWKRGRDSVTQGVYMWSEPFIVQTAKRKVSFIFKFYFYATEKGLNTMKQAPVPL